MTSPDEFLGFRQSVRSPRHFDFLPFGRKPPYPSRNHGCNAVKKGTVVQSTSNNGIIQIHRSGVETASRHVRPHLWIQNGEAASQARAPHDSTRKGGEQVLCWRDLLVLENELLGK